MPDEVLLSNVFLDFVVSDEFDFPYNNVHIPDRCF